MAFRGDLKTQSIHVSLPPALPLEFVSFDRASFVVDSAMHDKEAIASQLIALDQQSSTSRPSVVERIKVTRELSRDVVVSDGALLHWSPTTFYEIVDPPANTIGLTPGACRAWSCTHRRWLTAVLGIGFPQSEFTA